MTTRLLSIVAVALAAGAWVSQSPRTSPIERPVERVAEDRLDRVERWLKNLDRHVPGEQDEAVLEVADWSNQQLRWLWIDANVIIQLSRNPRLARFVVRAEGDSRSNAIRYMPAQLQRLQTLGCVAAGTLMTDSCLVLGAAEAMDPELRRLSGRVAAARLHHDDNYVLRRAALMHTDVAVLTTSSPGEPVSNVVTSTPQRVRVQMVDGQELGVRQTPVHWEIARMALDYVQPPGMDRPAPSKDDMVRQWYRATAAWMQQVEDHDTLHLDRARTIFPDDPDLEFLSGCQRESYAAPAIQAAMRTAVLPTGFALALGNDRTELHGAETHLRRALVLRSDFPEARLRLGRVLGLLGRHEDAARELAQAETSVDIPLLRYFATLFLGAEEEALGRYDEAREHYEQAAAIYPMAQSPWLALSELARRRGDRASALRALQQMFELPSTEPERDDPWWIYHVAQARDAADLLDTVRRPFLPETMK